MTEVPREPVNQEQHGGVFHVVVEGETIYGLARANDVTERALLEENLLARPEDLRAGTEIFIPRADDAPPVAADVDAPPPPTALRDISPAPQQRRRLLPPVTHAEHPTLAWPVRGVLYSRFGPRDRDFHDGIDIACPEGTPVAAARAGKVVFAGEQRGYGNIVLVRHDDGLVTVYAHNAANEVREGDAVAAGQEIARVGRTGRTTGPHLHFEVRENAKPHDPLAYLP